jgi:hypothetical protein
LAGFEATPEAKLLAIGLILQSQANPLQHEPCGLLSDSQSAMHFRATDAVLAISQHPESGHPLIHPERGILEDRSNLYGELLVASTAEPDAACLNEIVLVGIAARASNLI